MIASLSESERPEALRELTEGLTDPEVAEYLYRWDFWARDKQRLPDGDWFAWLILSGRGFGKTRTGAETIRHWANEMPGARFALVAETSADARDVLVEGESGLLACYPDGDPAKPDYYPSKRRIEWPNGCLGTTFSGEEPDQLRGPQHHKAWVDELAKYKYPQEAWDNLTLGLRLGDSPQAIITTTPRPIKVVVDLVNDPDVSVTTGTTYENITNLPQRFVSRVVRRYEGTTLGRQELLAEILTDVPGAMWSRETLDQTRVKTSAVPELVRIAVGVDPPGSSDPESGAEAGIVVAGVCSNGHGYVLADMSRTATPSQWGTAAVAAYDAWRADRIVAERNYGGEMVEHVIRTVAPLVPVHVVTASRGKQKRAEPVAGLYEQGRVHHTGIFARLEDQMCTWLPGEERRGVQASPDRMDALVWVLTWLMLGGIIPTEGWATHRR